MWSKWMSIELIIHHKKIIKNKKKNKLRIELRNLIGMVLVDQGDCCANGNVLVLIQWQMAQSMSLCPLFCYFTTRTTKFHAKNICATHNCQCRVATLTVCLEKFKITLIQTNAKRIETVAARPWHMLVDTSQRTGLFVEWRDCRDVVNIFRRKSVLFTFRLVTVWRVECDCDFIALKTHTKVNVLLKTSNLPTQSAVYSLWRKHFQKLARNSTLSTISFKILQMNQHQNTNTCLAWSYFTSTWG